MGINVPPKRQLTIRPEALARFDFIDGLDLIPLHAYDDVSKDPNTGKPRQDGKRPLHGNWQKRKYDSDEVVSDCEKHNRNVGVRPGPGWIVADIDPRNGGSLEALEAATPGFDWSKAPRSRTGGGGFHLYTRTTRDPTRLMETLESLPGIEFKKLGRQVVAPGSVHPETRKYYTWDNDVPLIDAPTFPNDLADKLTKPERTGKVTGGHVAPGELAASLKHLDPTKFRDEPEWRKLLFACHHATGGEARDEFIDWSTQDPNYADDDWRIGNRWDSLDPNKGDGITYKTLNKILRDHGAEDATIPEDAAADFDDVEESTAKPSGKYKTATISELLKQPNPKWLIQGLLIERGLYEIYGRFKTGKTFWAVEIACCIATGHDFFDIPVKQGRVLYIIAEGSRKLFAYRLKQWAKERSEDEADLARLLKILETNIDILSIAVPIDVAEEVKAFIADNPSERSIVVIDTLFRSMKGDVMNPGDFQKFVNGCAYIQRKLSCGVLFLHHQKRNDGKGAFGSVVNEASVDVALKTSAPRKRVSLLKVEIMRDGDANQKPWEGKIEKREIDDPTLAEGDVSTIGALVFEGRGTADALHTILQTILEHEPESVEDLVRATPGGLIKRTIERRLKKCRENGWVAAGSLTLTKEGEAQVSYDFEDFEDEE